jgi:hypothetical protein
VGYHPYENALQSSINVISVTAYFNWNLILADPDNNKFTDAYLNGNADYPDER